MFNGMNGIMPVMDINGNRNNDGFGDGGWWAWILLFAIFDWGGNGFGWGGNGGSQASFTDAAIQRGFDNQAVISKLDGLSSGLCDSTYALNNSIQQGNFGLQTAIMQGNNALQSQLADCCCTTQRSIDQVRFDNAQNTCAITTQMNQGFAQLDRTISDQFCQLKMEQKDATIAEQQNLINALNLAQSQANQNQYLVDQLRPCPTPAYITCNPWASNGTAYNGCCGVPTGCGC